MVIQGTSPLKIARSSSSTFSFTLTIVIEL
jgi:hypothetical protein